MSSPYVSVIFKDSADGYEFSVASYLYYGTQNEQIADARKFADASIESGDFRPEGDLIFDRIER